MELQVWRNRGTARPVRVALVIDHEDEILGCVRVEAPTTPRGLHVAEQSILAEYGPGVRVLWLGSWERTLRLLADAEEMVIR